MNLEGIDVFVRVVQQGSFAAAARLLGMPTTTARPGSRGLRSGWA